MIPLIPTPDTIPTHWGYFQFFILLTFPLHLLFMNALLGSSVIAIYMHLKGSTQSKSLAYELAKVIPLLIALTVNLGVAPFLFLQVLYGHFIYSSSVLMGMYWLMIIPVLLAAYYSAYVYDFKFSTLGRYGVVVLFGAFLGFLFIGFMLSNNMTLMLHPETWETYLENSRGTFLNMADVTLWPRYLHFMVGGTAVGGLFVSLYGRWITRSDRALGDYASAVGMKLFLGLTLVQIAVGFWFLLALPQAQMMLFMGGNNLATLCFVVALLLLASLLVTAFKKKIYASTAVLFGLLCAMVLMRDFLRSGYLQEHFTLEMLKVAPEYSPLILFLVTLVVGLALVAWMVRVALTRCSD
jgi:hypothetical protein